MTDARIDHTVTSGTFSLDGQTFDVDNNVWVVGDDTECVVIDAPHDVQAILEVVGDRKVLAVLCTHAHDDHVRFARTSAGPLRRRCCCIPPTCRCGGYPRRPPDGELADGQQIPVADIALEVLHTPGHAPGAVCFYSPDLGVVFTGDTLFNGGPGATGRSFSDKDLILASITERLMGLPADTVVKTGHGDDTTIKAESGIS